MKNLFNKNIYFIFLIVCSCSKIFDKADIKKKSIYKVEDKYLFKIVDQYSNLTNSNIIKDELFYELGKLCFNISNISLMEYNSNTIYKDVFHLRIVKSVNFGNFIAYDGFHFNYLIKNFTNSHLFDNAVYYLIYIKPNEFNYYDINQEKYHNN